MATVQENNDMGEKAEQKNNSALFRCVYVDPEYGVVTVGRVEDYLFGQGLFANKKRNGYNEEIAVIIKNVTSEINKLTKIVKNLEQPILKQLLINLRYLVKHVAFKEEQECRIIKICHLVDDKEKINLQDNSKQIYIEYPQKISSHIDTIYFGPKATDKELFEDINVRHGLKIKLEKSKSPLA